MPTALVTGASRGVGKGIALALADAGFRVFATGRTIAGSSLPSSIIRMPCNHTRDDQTAAVFDRLARDCGSLDVLVNSAWAGYERMVDDQGVFTWAVPFWQQPGYRWASMMDAGVRTAFVASQHAARLMVPRSHGFIVNISHWAAQKRIGNVIYGVSKAATDKMTSDMAHELRPFGIAAISLYPGLVRTEAVLAAAAGGWFDLSNSESPEFVGRVINALYRDEGLMDRTGTVVVAAAAAQELGVVDLDGRQPRPLTFETA